MCKKFASLVLALLIVLGCTAGVSAKQATAPATWEEKINALELHPIDPANITGNSAEYRLMEYNRYASLVKPGMTNYQILRAAYEHVVLNYRKDSDSNMPGFFQCTSYANELGTALYYLGFDARYMQGECTTKSGGWTGHAWTAIRIGDEILYFDANIPAEHGGNIDTYFAMPENTTFYRNAEAYVVLMSPDLDWSTVRKEGEEVPENWWIH